MTIVLSNVFEASLTYKLTLNARIFLPMNKYSRQLVGAVQTILATLSTKQLTDSLTTLRWITYETTFFDFFFFLGRVLLGRSVTVGSLRAQQILGLSRSREQFHELTK